MTGRDGALSSGDESLLSRSIPLRQRAVSITLRELFDVPQRPGTVQWIGVRPARRAPPLHPAEVNAIAGRGLEGDRYDNTGGGRQVTLIQAEHVAAVAAFLGRDTLPPELLRRNLLVRGINLLALKDRRFRVGEAVFEWSGLCHPCSRMEQVLGPGGYNAMRGHGGITARVLESGRIALGSPVRMEQPD